MEVNSQTLLTNVMALVKGADNSRGTGLEHRAGTEFIATVIAKTGEQYVLAIGKQKYLAEAETALEVGSQITVVVKGSKDQLVVLQKQAELPATKAQQEAQTLVRLLGKYGVIRQQEMSQVKQGLQRLPVDEKTGVRYLLDPHLLAAMILPQAQASEFSGQIEVNQYRRPRVAGGHLWEITLTLDLTRLGVMEVLLRLTEETSYLKIWAASGETEGLLLQHRQELEEICRMVEVLPAQQGPFIHTESIVQVDVKV